MYASLTRANPSAHSLCTFQSHTHRDLNTHSHTHLRLSEECIKQVLAKSSVTAEARFDKDDRSPSSPTGEAHFTPHPFLQRHRRENRTFRQDGMRQLANWHLELDGDHCQPPSSLRHIHPSTYQSQTTNQRVREREWESKNKMKNSTHPLTVINNTEMLLSHISVFLFSDFLPLSLSLPCAMLWSCHRETQPLHFSLPIHFSASSSPPHIPFESQVVMFVLFIFTR